MLLKEPYEALVNKNIYIIAIEWWLVLGRPHNSFADVKHLVSQVIFFDKITIMQTDTLEN